MFTIFTSKDIEKTNTLMPSYKNPRLNYFRLKYNNDVYTNTKKTYFNYGYMIKHPIVIESVSIENLKRSYYKSIYTIRNYFLHDSIELKYIGENFDQIAIYISEIIQNDIDIKPYECQYLITKPSGEYRSMYIDDIISDIIYAAIIITKGVELDNLQNDEIGRAHV